MGSVKKRLFRNMKLHLFLLFTLSYLLCTYAQDSTTDVSTDAPTETPVASTTAAPTNAPTDPSTDAPNTTTAAPTDAPTDAPTEPPINNPCEGVTVGACNIDAEIIVGSNPFPAALCQKQCALNDLCTYWRHDGTTCYYLNSDYHQDCATFSGPVSADVLGCLAVDQTSCGSIIQENCVYTGEDSTLEPGAHQISDVFECQEYCQNLIDFGFDVFAFDFDAPLEECRVYTSEYSAECTGIGAPATAPNLDVCNTKA